MTDVQRGVFLTVTDLLGERTNLALDDMGGSALDHVVAFYAVNDEDHGCFLGSRCCGGIEANRAYFVADDVLLTAWRSDLAHVPAWRASEDLAGPHRPFTASRETRDGQPRGQIQFFARDDDAVPLNRRGVEGLVDAHVVEIDLDYNFWHDSNPQCVYGGNPGLERYAAKWSALGTGAPVVLAYSPSGC